MLGRWRCEDLMGTSHRRIARLTLRSQVLANHNAPFRGRGALQAAAKSNDIPASAFLLAHGVDVDEVPAEDTWDPR